MKLEILRTQFWGISFSDTMEGREGGSLITRHTQANLV